MFKNIMRLIKAICLLMSMGIIAMIFGLPGIVVLIFVVSTTIAKHVNMRVKISIIDEP